MDEHREQDPQRDEPNPATPPPPPSPTWPPPATWAGPSPADTAQFPAAGAVPPPPGMPPGMPPVPPYGAPGPYGHLPPYGWTWGHTPQPPRRPGRALVALVVALGVAIAAAAGGLVGHQIWRAESTPSNGIGVPPFSQPPAGNSNSGGPQDAASIATNVDPGLVDINTQIDAQGLEGAGTGMVLTPSGEILTNNHVIEGADRISVTDVGNGKTYTAQVVGYDRSHDIAVLHLVGASGLQTVSIGDSAKLNVGQGVVAIGNANGTGGTPTYAGGTITGLNQTITASDQADGSSEQLQGLIETNANIVEGDSGGPLVDTAGRVIGIDTAASSGYRFQTNGTQGFSIPINQAMSVARQIEGGKASATVHIGPTALLGVEVRAATSGFGGFGGGSGSGSSGADVVGVLNTGPAAQAGIVAGDVITSVDGHSVSSAESLTNLMLGEHPGATVPVQFVDNSGQTQTVQIKLASGPPQ